MESMNVYRDSTLREVVKAHEETTVVVLPVKEAEPNYRDTDPGYFRL